MGRCIKIATTALFIITLTFTFTFAQNPSQSEQAGAAEKDSKKTSRIIEIKRSEIYIDMEDPEEYGARPANGNGPADGAGR